KPLSKEKLEFLHWGIISLGFEIIVKYHF
ncbi:Hypothetical protein EIN_230640, partial [Entamoeba invadens IP1]